jgi:carbonic anhydrase/acetyltransferase-like protein (isoleucine patch superfamily)
MLQRSRLGAGSLLAAGAVLREGSEIPPGHLAAGVPAIVKKPLGGSSDRWVGMAAQVYKNRAILYREKLKPVDSK